MGCSYVLIIMLSRWFRFSYSNEANEKLKSVSHGEHNSRDVKFNAEGDKCYVLLNDKSLILYHTDGLKVERKITDASE